MGRRLLRRRGRLARQQQGRRARALCTVALPASVLLEPDAPAATGAIGSGAGAGAARRLFLWAPSVFQLGDDAQVPWVLALHPRADLPNAGQAHAPPRSPRLPCRRRMRIACIDRVGLFDGKFHPLGADGVAHALVPEGSSKILSCRMTGAIYADGASPGLHTGHAGSSCERLLPLLSPSCAPQPSLRLLVVLACSWLYWRRVGGGSGQCAINVLIAVGLARSCDDMFVTCWLHN
mmetsp:Transcript_81310/g.180894  ORF Transcript_81310/g.180894 Transcript_81310/m.180894 type:complete len:235 (-) Transcript_81310:727-1431(-)